MALPQSNEPAAAILFADIKLENHFLI